MTNIVSKWLEHIGTKEHSGRYPWGSGKSPEQRATSFLGYIEKLRNEGLSDVEISKGLHISTTQLRARSSIAKADKRLAQASQALRLKDKGLSNVAIGIRMGMNESSVRALLDPALQERSKITKVVANVIKESVKQKGLIDIGLGVEQSLGVSRTKMNTAIEALQMEGYTVHYVKTPQMGTNKFTSIKVLAAPGVLYTDVYKNRSNIHTITDQTSNDGGRSFYGLDPIKSVSSKRVGIRYREDGGSDKDGVIELRRNVKDLNIGGSNYAQVRIGVDGTHFLKGMAMYSDDMPDGVDIVYNTNKAKDTPKEKVFKPMKTDLDGTIDPDNPFGAVIKANGQRGALNIVNEEGDWDKWSRSISSQVLSKQTPELAKRQLGLASESKALAFSELKSLTNPAVKKVLLNSFSDDCDSSAVHLKAAALPRQASHVILPFPTIKEGEVYAPGYNDGEKVVLIRHPHGGIFEIPELTVNNRFAPANKAIGRAKDAIGIHPKVAEKLSGADFDGDSVLVIPNNRRDIRTAPTIKSLKGFDPKTSYPLPDSAPQLKDKMKQRLMGEVSNLITDMTIKGANENEIAAAVRHSMVVIDAEKHHLNYKLSAQDNGIAALKTKYQGGPRSGAATLISRASSVERVPHRKDQAIIDPNSGKVSYAKTGETYVTTTPKGVSKIVGRTTKSTKMAEKEDAFDLSSGTRIEKIYATHANTLKAMANEARRLMVNTKPIKYSPTAAKTYASEVENLKAQLNLALRNKPLERQAQLFANAVFMAKKERYPDLEPSDIKKIKGQALEEARHRMGASKHKITISDKQWEAIQLGAISNNTLNQILLNTDLDVLKQRAMPRTARTMPPTKIARAKTMLSSGRTQAEVAMALGVSTTMLSESLK